MLNIVYSWLYMLIVAMDANFRLRNRLRNATNREPSLGLGWAYFVNNGPYSDFIKDYVDEKEVCIYIEGTGLLMDDFVDSHLRWISGALEYAYQEIKGTLCDRHGGG